MDITTIVLLVISLVLFVWSAVLTLALRKIIVKNKELFKGEEKGDIYSTINSYLLKMRQIETQNSSILGKLDGISENYAECLQKIAIVRYNPFREIGGDQSFSLALLNKKDDGFVITSILSREGNRIYAKPVGGKKSEYHLSKEEVEAINLAVKK